VCPSTPSLRNVLGGLLGLALRLLLLHHDLVQLQVLLVDELLLRQAGLLVIVPFSILFLDDYCLIDALMRKLEVPEKIVLAASRADAVGTRRTTRRTGRTRVVRVLGERLPSGGED
jgi:hypothetical protein